MLPVGCSLSNLTRLNSNGLAYWKLNAMPTQ